MKLLCMILPALLCTQPLWLDWYPDITLLLRPSLKPLSWVRQGSGTVSTPESGGRVRKPWNEMWGEITDGFGAEGVKVSPAISRTRAHH